MKIFLHFLRNLFRPRTVDGALRAFKRAAEDLQFIIGQCRLKISDNVFRIDRIEAENEALTHESIRAAAAKEKLDRILNEDVGTAE